VDILVAEAIMEDSVVDTMEDLTVAITVDIMVDTMGDMAMVAMAPHLLAAC
jgi:hypothetical protein